MRNKEGRRKKRERKEIDGNYVESARKEIAIFA